METWGEAPSALRGDAGLAASSTFPFPFPAGVRKCTLHLFGCQEDGSSSTILLALLCVFSHSIALNNERSHDPPAGLDGMNLSGLNPMVIYLVSLFYAQMPQNSIRFFFFLQNTLFLLALTFLFFALRFALNSLCQTKFDRNSCLHGRVVPGNQVWELCALPQVWAGKQSPASEDEGGQMQKPEIPREQSSGRGEKCSECRVMNRQKPSLQQSPVLLGRVGVPGSTLQCSATLSRTRMNSPQDASYLG